MFTDNYFIFLRKKLGYGSDAKGVNPTSYYNEKISDNGWLSTDENISGLMGIYTTTQFLTSDYSGKSGVIFGDGTGEVTSKDYKLFGEPVFGFSSSNVTTISETRYDDKNRPQLFREYTLSNTLGKDVTIGEIGLCLSVFHYTGPSSGRYYPVLLDHTALENPITIPAGGVGKITYTITLDSPLSE